MSKSKAAKPGGRVRSNFQQPNQPLASTARTASKLGVDGLNDVCNGRVPWVKIPTYYYDFEQLCLPLTTSECSDFFDGEIPVFNVSGVPNRFTNAAVGSGVNEVFLALGAGVIAIGEGQAFTIHGARVPKPSAETTTPVVTGLSLCDNYCGAVDLSESVAGASHATFWWGGPTWRVIEKFFQAYRLVVKLAHRFEIVNESLFDVGMTPTPPEFVGASDSFIPTQPFIRATNDVIQGKEDIVDSFLTPNIMVLSGESVCLPPPIAPVTWGHPRITGLANRMYCFAQPIMFLPGMSFEVFFQQAAPVCAPEICTIATVQNQTADANWTDGGGGITNCGESFTFPGGSIDLGVVFKGYALWPSAAVHYIQNFLLGGSAMCQALMDGGVMNGVVGAALKTRVPYEGQNFELGNIPGNKGRTAFSVLNAKPDLDPGIPTIKA